MKVTVKLFAAARELAQSDELSVELASGATVGELREVLCRQFPVLEPLLGHAMFAVDRTYATDGAYVPEGAEVACIPPVSGG